MIQRNVDPTVHRLQRALEAGASREEVAEALTAAEQISPQDNEEDIGQRDSSLSPLLRYRATEYIQAERMLERRRLAFIVACVVGIFATVVGGFGLTTLDRMRSLVDRETEFEKLVAAEQWDKASDFLDQLDEPTQQEPAFTRGRELVEQAISREAERKAEFKRLSEQLRTAGQTPLDHQAVERLNELARSDEEVQIASEINAKAEEQRLEREAARANDQTHQFETLQNKVNHFLQVESKTLDEDARQARRFELQQELGRFVAQHQLGNPELSEAAKQAAKMLATSAAKQKVQGARDNLIGEITDAVGDAERFTGAIKEFVDQWPRDPLAARLLAEAPDAKSIDATLAWIRVLDHPGFQNPQRVDSAVATQWLETLGRAEAAEPDHPLAAQATRWRETYETIAACQDVIDELRDLFRSPLLNRVYVYPDPDGTVYYSDQAPKKDSQRAHVVPILVDTSMRRETKNFGLRFRDDVLPNVRPAGHSQFATKYAQSVSELDAIDFTPVGYRLINEIRTFQSDPEFDPIYRIILMRQLLSLVVKGSVPIRIAFGDWLESLDESGFDWETNWLATGDENLDRSVKATQATRLLESVDDWDKRVERMLEEFKSFRTPRPAAPRWVGWISMTGNQFEAVLNASTGTDPLAVFAVDPETRRTTLVDIGPAQASDPMVVTDPGAQRSGAMICVTPTSPSR